jgi:hypothetical protein
MTVEMSAARARAAIATGSPPSVLATCQIHTPLPATGSAGTYAPAHAGAPTTAATTPASSDRCLREDRAHRRPMLLDRPPVNGRSAADVPRAGAFRRGRREA